jgi:hypothetical protein
MDRPQIRVLSTPQLFEIWPITSSSKKVTGWHFMWTEPLCLRRRDVRLTTVTQLAMGNPPQTASVTGLTATVLVTAEWSDETPADRPNCCRVTIIVYQDQTQPGSRYEFTVGDQTDPPDLHPSIKPDARPQVEIVDRNLVCRRRAFCGQFPPRGEAVLWHSVEFIVSLDVEGTETETQREITSEVERWVVSFSP